MTEVFHNRNALISLILGFQGRDFRELFCQNKDRVYINSSIFENGINGHVFWDDTLKGQVNSNYRTAGCDFPGGDLKVHDIFKASPPSICSIGRDAIYEGNVSEIYAGNVVNWVDWDLSTLKKKADIIVDLRAGYCMLDACQIPEKYEFFLCLEEFYAWARENFNDYRRRGKNPHDEKYGYFYCKPCPGKRSSPTNQWQFTKKGIERWLWSTQYGKPFTNTVVLKNYREIVNNFSPEYRNKKFWPKETAEQLVDASAYYDC
jgi:hypothetical protein